MRRLRRGLKLEILRAQRPAASAVSRVASPAAGGGGTNVGSLLGRYVSRGRGAVNFPPPPTGPVSPVPGRPAVRYTATTPAQTGPSRLSGFGGAVGDAAAGLAAAGLEAFKRPQDRELSVARTGSVSRRVSEGRRHIRALSIS